MYATHCRCFGLQVEASIACTPSFESYKPLTLLTEVFHFFESHVTVKIDVVERPRSIIGSVPLQCHLEESIPAFRQRTAAVQRGMNAFGATKPKSHSQRKSTAPSQTKHAGGGAPVRVPDYIPCRIQPIRRWRYLPCNLCIGPRGPSLTDVGRTSRNERAFAATNKDHEK